MSLSEKVTHKKYNSDGNLVSGGNTRFSSCTTGNCIARTSTQKPDQFREYKENQLRSHDRKVSGDKQLGIENKP